MSTKTLLDTDSVQTATNKTFTAPVITAGVVDLAAAPTTNLGAATKGYVDGLNINPLNNGSLAASVATNILTVSLKTAGGATPSAADPVRVTFRNSTDSDGSLVTRTVTSATVMTCASGSSLGTANAVAARLWVGLIDNSGTVEICVWNPLVSATLSLKAFTPNTDVTTTAEGSGTATSAQVLYSTNARSSVPFVLLGFIEITEATAGVWATAPTAVQTYRDGIRKTGEIIQQQWNGTGAMATGTTTIPWDDTIPQITEGTEFQTQAITPTSTMNLLSISYTGNYASSIGQNVTCALFQDATASALAAAGQSFDTGGNIVTVALSKYMLTGTVSATTMRIRVGGEAGSTITFNGSGGARKFGGVLWSVLSITEIAV